VHNIFGHIFSPFGNANIKDNRLCKRCANEMQAYKASHIDHKALARTRDVKALGGVNNITQRRTKSRSEFMSQAPGVKQVLIMLFNYPKDVTTKASTVS
jgi:hypothetical protein